MSLCSQDLQEAGSADDKKCKKGTIHALRKKEAIRIEKRRADRRFQ
jgi:hypothetical protein